MGKKAVSSSAEVLAAASGSPAAAAAAAAAFPAAFHMKVEPTLGGTAADDLLTPPRRRSARVTQQETKRVSLTPEVVDDGEEGGLMEGEGGVVPETPEAAAAADVAAGRKGGKARRTKRKMKLDELQWAQDGNAAVPAEEEEAAPVKAKRTKKVLFQPPAEFLPLRPQRQKELYGEWDLRVVPVEPETQERIREIVAELEIEIAPETLDHILYARADNPLASPTPVAGPGPQSQGRAVPRLGYACLTMTTREWHPPVYTNRSCILRTYDAPGGAERAAAMSVENLRDLQALFLWNEVNGIRFFRMSSDMFPFSGMRYERLRDLSNFDQVEAQLVRAGKLARKLGHRITFHPSHFVKLASKDDETVRRSLLDLEIHSEILDLMGFQPSPENKLNIHIGGAYDDKDATLDRFVQNFARLSPNAQKRLTLENDDRGALYSLNDLLHVHRRTGIPLVFDFHHHKFCTGGLSSRDAFLAAVKTWPKGVRPVVHWSESQNGRIPSAHSDYVFDLVDTCHLTADVDVMIEAKAKELAVLRFLQDAADEAAGRVPGGTGRRRVGGDAGTGEVVEGVDEAAAAVLEGDDE